ncbi:LysR family transcriptional regulator [Pleomorphomonas diazotrophica]|uniref:LysR family transcriptional regulator n=1 Tax=Pleomorphomonas diazotrophica TaxID=1166257 RepID=A0A1I4UJM7_9HYPH|nr:LysR family transcriptional regulator [Pleomorphomonas diazotrophica]PKR89138.1 LysR family transcriptional regulator [Pleomorphomonas diazotrophica]SFM89158.1 DNA-binding transcriptional regulator, LysR family [Pleomorphomonas diazotrophica]
MRGVEYAELEAFLAVARLGSFRRAAEALTVSPSAISHTVRALEERLGTRLFHRTTRSLSLTEDGARLRDRIAPAFAAIAFSVAEAAREAGTLSGTVRLTVPRVASQMILAPRLPSFLRRHPDISVEVDINDQLIDSVAEGFDAGIRLGEALRSDMESLPISPPLRGLLVASPDYLARHGRPREPADLDGHRWLNYRLGAGRTLAWEFQRGDAGTVLSKAGALSTNDADLLIAAALEGCGIACVTEGTVDPHLKSGGLVTVLEEWSQPYPGWFIYFPKGRLLSPALRLLCRHLGEGFLGDDA